MYKYNLYFRLNLNFTVSELTFLHVVFSINYEFYLYYISCTYIRHKLRLTFHVVDADDNDDDDVCGSLSC